MSGRTPRNDTPADIEARLREALAGAGQPIEGKIPFGTLHRYGGSKQPCWLAAHRLSNGHIAAVFGDWRQDSRCEFQSWLNGSGRPVRGIDAAALQRELDQQRHHAEARAQRKTAHAARIAAGIIEHCPREGASAYLSDKQVGAHGLRFGQDEHGPFIAVPMVELTDGALKSVQRIDSGGNKRFLPGTPLKSGALCHPIGVELDLLSADKDLWLAEGYATAATVHELTGAPVLVAFDAANLARVARAARERWPDSRLAIAADNDQWKAGHPVDPDKPNGKRKGNTGIEVARKTADTADARLAVPDFTGLVDADQARASGEGPTDFNDLFRLAGADETRRQLEGESDPGEGEGHGKDDQAAIEGLAALPLLEYERRRQSEAERLGVRASVLDKLVDQARRAQTGDDDQAGRRLDLEDPEPWDEPVDGAELLADIAHAITRHCALPKGAATASALWILHSYCLRDLFVSPLLCLTSPEKRCGKTTLLMLVGTLSYRPLTASHITPAALFRAVEKWAPTLLIDEADTFLRESDELRGVINSGHTRASAQVVRTVEIGGQHEPCRFSTWCAKAIALIGSMADTLEDRSIVLRLKRRAPGEAVERLRLDQLDRHEDIPRRCQRWANDNGAAIRAADPRLPAGLNDRAADNWRSLFTIAEVAGGDWPGQARAAVLALVGIDEDAPSIGTELLADIKAAFENRYRDRLSSADLLEALTADEEAPWATWNRGKPMSPRQLATRLKEFGIVSYTIRVGNATPKGYHINQFDDAFARYLPSLSATPPQTTTGAGSGDFLSATSDPMLRIVKGREASNGGGCGGVADRNPGKGGLRCKTDDPEYT